MYSLDLSGKIAMENHHFSKQETIETSVVGDARSPKWEVLCALRALYALRAAGVGPGLAENILI